MVMITAAIQEHELILDEFAEIGGKREAFQLVNMTSDGAYLHAQKDGEPAVDYYVNDKLYTGPLYEGWGHDAAHQLELIRTEALNENKNLKYFIQSKKSGISVLTTSKWSTASMNVSKQKDIKPRKCKSV